MLTLMETGTLLEHAKNSAGLSVRQLSRRARVASSTITRIQAGAVDPSIATLKRILEASGFELELLAIRRGTPRRPRLGTLASAWTRKKGRLRLVWPQWRALFDDLALHPDLIPEAIYEPPPPAGEPIVDALLAGAAEKLADDASLPRPGWTAATPPLAEPYQPLRARPGLERSVPPQLRQRGVLIDTESLWRKPATVGA
jgi:transcriptional regulator with XRE-family HTH domain